MSFNTHARCDWCEQVALVGDEDELLEEGWLTVSYGLTEEARVDFCTLECLQRWAKADSTKELIASAVSEEEPDE